MKIVGYGIAENVKRAGGETTIRFELQLAKVVEGHKGPDSQRVELGMEVRLKTLVSDELKIGQQLYVTVSTEKPEEL